MRKVRIGWCNRGNIGAGWKHDGVREVKPEQDKTVGMEGGRLERDSIVQTYWVQK